MTTSVRDIAERLANAIDIESGKDVDLRRDLRSFVDGMFLELPEDRMRLLGQLSMIVNNYAENADTTRPSWVEMRRIWQECVF